MKTDCKVMEENIDSFNKPSKPLFREMIHEFHVCFGWGTPWERVMFNL